MHQQIRKSLVEHVSATAASGITSQNFEICEHFVNFVDFFCRLHAHVCHVWKVLRRGSHQVVLGTLSMKVPLRVLPAVGDTVPFSLTLHIHNH